MVTGKKRITYGKVFLYLFTSLIAACCFLPILLIVIVSFTSEQAIVHNGYSFFPSELSLVAYNTGCLLYTSQGNVEELPHLIGTIDAGGLVVVLADALDATDPNQHEMANHSEAV